MPAVQEFLPEQDTLTPEQVKMVDEFAAAHLPADALPPAYAALAKDEEGRKITAYKYLVARKWKPEDAAKMFTEAMAFRQSVGFDSTPVFPTPFPVRGYDAAAIIEVLGMAPRPPGLTDDVYHNLKRISHFGYHFWDKAGHPVIIDCSGRADATALVAKCKEMTHPGDDVAKVLIDLHIHQNQVAAGLVRYQDLVKAGKNADGSARRVTSATIVMDARGLGFGHLFGEAVEILKKTWAQDAAYFPEGMHRMFVVNCPSMIMFAYNLFKGMIDKRTQDKVTFCSEADTPAALRAVIAAEHLPKFLGGDCECEGGCVFSDKPGEEDDPSNDPYTGALVKTLDLAVAAGAAWSKTYDIAAGHTFVWKFESATGSDVEYSVVFEPTEGSSAGKKRDVIAAKKAKAGEDSFVAEGGAGQLTIKFDNSFSWLKEKVVRFRLVKMSADGVDPASPTLPTKTA